MRFLKDQPFIMGFVYTKVINDCLFQVQMCYCLQLNSHLCLSLCMHFSIKSVQILYVYFFPSYKNKRRNFTWYIVAVRETNILTKTNSPSMHSQLLSFIWCQLNTFGSVSFLSPSHTCTSLWYMLLFCTLPFTDLSTVWGSPHLYFSFWIP